MPHWQPIDPEQHTQACWFKYPDYRFANADHLALSPLVAQIQQFHQQRFQALALTQTLLDQLQQADLITDGDDVVLDFDRLQ